MRLFSTTTELDRFHTGETELEWKFLDKAVPRSFLKKIFPGISRTINFWTNKTQSPIADDLGLLINKYCFPHPLLDDLFRSNQLPNVLNQHQLDALFAILMNYNNVEKYAIMSTLVDRISFGQWKNYLNFVIKENNTKYLRPNFMKNLHQFKNILQKIALQSDCMTHDVRNLLDEFFAKFIPDFQPTFTVTSNKTAISPKN
jgi:hypothetical protein